MGSKTADGIICGIHYLKLAEEYFQDWCRQYPKSPGANLFAQYNKRINWILNDIVTNPVFPHDVREGLRKDLKSDLLLITDVSDKLSKIPAASREAIEQIIDLVLAGEEIHFTQ